MGCYIFTSSGEAALGTLELRYMIVLSTRTEVPFIQGIIPTAWHHAYFIGGQLANKSKRVSERTNK